ncbi:MAG: Unknown protein [uncultured Sulfurovum sp.]|uniref:Barstar (barnase inhibitor) domain-containing protein n=1 Tax=uncultured Sulfurovum sp. TaxID=269237 RepID=A0A6S6SS28_9BACT|nr:MAG: Unknown protein [uncultured Sulfurovum sp.]
MNTIKLEHVAKLLNDFGMLFGQDWDYTCEMMGIDQSGLPNNGETFLTKYWSNWASRDGLLKHYENLTNILDSSLLNEKGLVEECKLFIYFIEEVLENDWQWTCWALGIENEEVTFLNPQVEDETEDWGYRGSFLMNYRKVKSLITEPKNKRTICLNLNRIQSKKQFLEMMHEAFYFPSYFGFNLDALDECMRDLAWIVEEEILVEVKNKSHLEEQNRNLYNVIMESFQLYNEYWAREEKVVLFKYLG